MVRRTFWGVAVTVVLLASTALAQPPGGRGGFRRGGFGAFGGGQVSSMALLRMDEVREELNITDQQAGQVDAILDEAREAMREGFNFRDVQGLSEDERRERFAEMREKQEQIAKETDEKLAGVLQADQVKRLGQLKLQREGVNALLQEEVAKTLGLSDEQQQKLRDLQQAAARPAGDRGNFQDLSQEERQELFSQLRQRREQAEADMLAVLTDAQKQQWQEMQGKPFEFPRGGRGFRGGRGQGGRQQ